jgi:hypothetical protein
MKIQKNKLVLAIIGASSCYWSVGSALGYGIAPNPGSVTLIGTTWNNGDANVYSGYTANNFLVVIVLM